MSNKGYFTLNIIKELKKITKADLCRLKTCPLALDYLIIKENYENKKIKPTI